MDEAELIRMLGSAFLRNGYEARSQASTKTAKSVSNQQQQGIHTLCCFPLALTLELLLQPKTGNR